MAVLRNRSFMKIERAEIFSLRIPLRKPVRRVHGLTTHQKSLVVKIIADNGEYGIGAIEPSPGYDLESCDQMVGIIETHLSPLIIGKDPFQIKGILDMMDREVTGYQGAKAAVEMALFDLVGKSLGVPVHVMFGGRVRDTLHLNGWIGVVEPEEARQEVRGFLEKGFASVKVKIDSDVTATRRRVEAVRTEGQNSLQIRVDANESLDMEKALETVKALDGLGCLYLEQPFPRDAIQDLAALSKTSSLKIMADESVYDLETLSQILRLGAAQFVKLKVQKVGGLLRTHQMIQVAEAFGVPVILGHGFGLTINTLSELHLAASTKAVLDGGEFVGPMKMADDVVKEPLEMDSGLIDVPTRPGLGVELDDRRMERYRLR